jgi:hypothetical protein
LTSTHRNIAIPTIAEDLGVKRRDRKWGPCPACSGDRTRKDKRPPLILGHSDRSWTCYACGESGDAIDMISWALLGCRGREAGPRFGEVLEWLKDRRILVEAAEYRPEPPRRAHRPSLLDGFRTSTPVAKCRRRDVLQFCESRGYRPRYTPGGILHENFRARFWPGSFTECWPLVVPAFNGRGELRGIHGRAIHDDIVESEGRTMRMGCDDDSRHAWHDGRCETCGVYQGRKSTWPVSVSSRGLVFADPNHARPWLQEKGPAPEKLFVVEGITDYLSAYSSSPKTAVLGIESGSHPAFLDMPWKRGMRVYIATDLDEAGDNYMLNLVNAIPAGVLVSRVKPTT